MESIIEATLNIKKASESNLSEIIRNTDKNRSLLITSANTKSGVTSSTLSLANELSKAIEGNVLIIDTSNSENSLTRTLKQEKSLGLMDINYSIKDYAIEGHYYKIKNSNIFFMPKGFSNKNSHTIFNNDLNEILEKLANTFSFVLIDGEAIYSNTNAIEISSKVDGVILVIQAEETRWEVAQAAQKRLVQAGANIIGCVFNNRKYHTPSWIYNKL